MRPPRLSTAAPIEAICPRGVDAQMKARVLGPLVRAGIDTVGHLLDQSAWDVASVDGMGPGPARVVVGWLSLWGLHLAPVDPHQAGRQVEQEPLTSSQVSRVVAITGRPGEKGDAA